MADIVKSVKLRGRWDQDLIAALARIPNFSEACRQGLRAVLFGDARTPVVTVAWAGPRRRRQDRPKADASATENLSKLLDEF